MFNKKMYRTLSIIIDLLFPVVFALFAFNYRGNILGQLGGGFVYFCFAGYLGILSCFPKNRNQTIAAAYLLLILGVLNYLSNKSVGSFWRGSSIEFAIGTALLYAVFLVVLLLDKAPTIGPTFEFSLRDRHFRFRKALSIAVAVQVAGSTCGALALSTYWIATEGGKPWLRWNPFQYGLFFDALFSITVGIVLCWPNSLVSTSLPIKFSALTTVLIFILLTALAEYFFRKNWSLFSLSSMASLGVFVTYYCAWFCRSANLAPDADSAIETTTRSH